MRCCICGSYWVPIHSVAEWMQTNHFMIRNLSTSTCEHQCQQNHTKNVFVYFRYSESVCMVWQWKKEWKPQALDNTHCGLGPVEAVSQGCSFSIHLSCFWGGLLGNTENLRVVGFMQEAQLSLILQIVYHYITKINFFTHDGLLWGYFCLGTAHINPTMAWRLQSCDNHAACSSNNSPSENPFHHSLISSPLDGLYPSLSTFLYVSKHFINCHVSVW